MKAVVVYKSKTGFSKKYADWIAEELQADIYNAANTTVDMLNSYDVVIYGSGLYAVGINGVKLITQNLEKLAAKKIVVYATGASPAREEAIDEVRNQNFTQEQQKHIKFFYLRGGFDYNKLKPLDKVLMLLLKFKLKRKRKLTLDDRGMLAAYERPVDFTQKKNINDLIKYVNS